MSDAIKSGALTGVLTGTLVTIPNVAQAAAEAAPAGITIAQAAPIFLGGCVVGAVAGGVVSHFATARALRSGEAVRASEEAEQARHRAAESQEEPAGTGRRPGKHFRDANWEQQGSIRVQNVEDSTVLHVPDFVKNIDSSSAKPASDAPRTVAESVPEVVSDSEDYGDVAEKYVRRMTFRERMSTRAKGVKAVLQDRLAGDMMDGLPVIRRADGTTGDVGTSWWEAAVGDSVRRDSIDSDFLEDTTAHEVEERPLVPRRIVDPADPREAAPAATATAPAAQNRQTPQESISARVAQVDEGVFPEHRDLDDLAKSEDSFEAALKALDERIALQVPIEFDDEVGGADTIDEPEGLEGSTSFIPFRMPAGHPEVVDTDSYVDYLIDDEFSQNPSNAVRRGAKTFLRVIEGGSQKLGDTHPQKKTEHHASHFAEAKEA